MSESCACGHVYDEHEYPGKDCTAEGCDCIYFEGSEVDVQDSDHR